MTKLLMAVVLCLFMAGCSNTRVTETSNLDTLGLSQVVPNSVGIFIHDLTAKNLDRATKAGFKIVRTDLNWAEVEHVKGQYDWSYYDPIVSRLKARGLRPLFSLGFNNPLYGEGYMDALDTPQERAGFTKFAVAAVKRYQNTINPLWEIYNEPNRPSFWSDPSAEEYMKLVKTVIPAMRQASSNLFIIGPAVGHAPGADPESLIKVDFGYLESTLALGILRYVDAVSLHPYPDGQPELAFSIYDDVRYLINMYAPGKTVPIISSEWGYSSVAAFSGSEQQHANYLTRMYLINLSKNVLSIGYKLEEYSFDPTIDEYELAFGWFKKNGQAKLVYTQVQAMINSLKGLSFVKRLASAPNDYLMEFSNGTKTMAAVWTTGSVHTVSVYNKSVSIGGKPVYITK
jgi:polysaccharide biosynthesis protein PslG